jgi:hypothetical protein
MPAITTGTRREARCLAPGCGRKLTARKSVEAGYGPTHLRQIREAAENQVLAGIKPEQADKTRQLIADKGIIPAGRPGFYQAVSEDGQQVHITCARGCTCQAGKRRKLVVCYHVLAARVLDLIRTRTVGLATVTRLPITPPYTPTTVAGLPAAA